MDLQDPFRKMSTTGSEERGLIFVDDDEAAIVKKLKSAVTDSGSEVRRGDDKPGITNLIDILAATRGLGPAEIEREFADSRYGEFKLAVAHAVAAYLAPVRERYAQLRPDEAALEAALTQGAERARAIASETLVDVRDAMGIGAQRPA